MRKQPRSNLLNALSDLHLLIFMATSDMLPLKVRLKEKNLFRAFVCISRNSVICNIYNMIGRVVSDIQTRAEGESLYI